MRTGTGPYNRAVQDAARSTPFRELTIGRFVERLSSSDAVPGGGSASAVAGAIAASLVAMVAGLSANRPRYAVHADLLASADARSRDLADRLLTLADEDADAYATFADAARRPRATEIEIRDRAAAMAAAAREASEVPLGCLEACREVVLLAESLAGRSNANASSDLGVASLLAEAAARGAAANVLVNLPSVDDQVWADHARARVATLLEQTQALAAQAGAAVASGEAREPLATAG